MASASKSDDSSYDHALALRIQPEFEGYIKPMSVLHYFNKYNEKIITRRDKENIEACKTAKGDIDGALVLLERLCVYNGWFDCLNKVLRDPEVRLGHVADKMERKKAQLDREWSQQNLSSKLSVSSGDSESGFHLSRTTPRRSDEDKSGPMSQQQTMGNEDYANMDMSTLKLNLKVDAQDDGHLTPVNHRYGDVNAGQEDDHEDDFVIIANGPDFTDGTATASMKSPETEKKVISRNPQELSPIDSDLTSPVPENNHVHFSEGTARSPEAEDQSQTQKELNGKKKVPMKKHGPEYDFTKEDTALELSQCPGWHFEMTEIKIWQTLKPLLEEDGHYILWHWEQRKRPALCVTDRKELKTLLIHKRPDKRNKDKVLGYFIDKKQKISKSLRDIVEHHIANGVKNMTKGKENETISFLHPVSMKASDQQ